MLKSAYADSLPFASSPQAATARPKRSGGGLLSWFGLFQITLLWTAEDCFERTAGAACATEHSFLHFASGGTERARLGGASPRVCEKQSEAKFIGSGTRNGFPTLPCRPALGFPQAVLRTPKRVGSPPGRMRKKADFRCFRRLSGS